MIIGLVLLVKENIFDPPVNDNGNEYRENGYMTDILTRKTITWLKELRDPNKPFSLNLWHKAVHQPFSPAPRHEGIYSNEELPIPPYDTHKETLKENHIGREKNIWL